jgi:hypothetical protein
MAGPMSDQFCGRAKSAKLDANLERLFHRADVTMLVEAGKLFSVIACILTLYSLFYATFLQPSVELGQRLIDSTGLLVLAAAIAVVSGLIFREADREWNPRVRLISTLPVQMFCWASGAMTILFLLSLYLASHCVLYGDVRFYAGM